MPSALENLILQSALRRQQTPRSAVTLSLAQNAAGGQTQVRDWGDAVANIAKSLVGAYGTYTGLQQQEAEAAEDKASIQGALAAAQQPEPPRIGDISPKDFTPQSLAAYQQSGDYSMLKPVGGDTPKAPPMRTITRGDQEVQQELAAEGWRDVGSGPRWAPQQPGADPLVEVADPNSPTGVRLVPRSQAAGAAAPQKGMVLGYDDEGRPVVTMGGAAMPGAGQPAKVPESVRTKYAEQRATLQAARDDFNVLRQFNPNFWDRVGATGGLLGPEGAKANSAMSALKFKVAKLEEQGALQAPDREVVEGMIGHIFDPRTGPKAREAGLAQFDAWLASKERALESTIGTVAPPAAPIADVSKPPSMSESVDRHTRDAMSGSSQPKRWVWKDGKLVPE